MSTIIHQELGWPAQVWCYAQRKQNLPINYNNLALFLHERKPHVPLDGCLEDAKILVEQFFEDEKQIVRLNKKLNAMPELRVKRFTTTNDWRVIKLKRQSIVWAKSRLKSELPLLATDLALKLFRFFGQESLDYYQDFANKFIRELEEIEVDEPSNREDKAKRVSVGQTQVDATQ